MSATLTIRGAFPLEQMRSSTYRVDNAVPFADAVGARRTDVSPS